MVSSYSQANKIMSQQVENNVESQSNILKAEGKKNWQYIIIFLIWIIVTFYALMVFTSLTNSWMSPVESSAFQENNYVSSIIINVLFYFFIVFYFVYKDKVNQFVGAESDVIIRSSEWERERDIRVIARDRKGMMLGNHLHTISEPAHGPGSENPSVKFFYFENITGDMLLDGVSCWKESYTKSITTDLVDKYFLGRESYFEYLSGEPKQNILSVIGDHSNKKKKEYSNVVNYDSEGSVTE